MGSGRKLFKALAAGVEKLTEAVNQQNVESTSASLPQQNQPSWQGNTSPTPAQQHTFPSPSGAHYNVGEPNQQLDEAAATNQYPGPSPAAKTMTYPGQAPAPPPPTHEPTPASSAPHRNPASSTRDDEEKKKFIISTQRQLWSMVCEMLGTQPPLVKLSDSGSASFYWANEDELALSVYRVYNHVITGGTSPHQRRATVERLSTESWRNDARVSSSVRQLEAELAVLIVSFASYREMVDVMYRTSKRAAEMQQKQTESASAQQSAAAATARIEQDRARIDAIMQQAERDRVKIGQITGAVPMYYTNGVPHYGGVHF
ncbi:hypothetical protein BWQ96_09603 [Gracilariopsis chorda]|uniref:Uncharacterized protein n=1 Tax=Gracilariopsis chorda TaxID=448386 RepID=A0A2V3IF20_9FLOR|nr:hypothetical protein BWQ96_09603 [Gracilariopsis chorda]|eukprot:PXF40685.1 hypothetical protein BWQ96_09603 [Gracilariopsis chorda]